jgi:hypothetical protein
MNRLVVIILGILFVIVLRAQDRAPHPELENLAIQGINQEYKYSFTLVPVYSTKKVEAVAKLKY